MKLNTRRTVLVGLAFLSISAFWQLYDNVIPLILRDTFHMGDNWTGVVMAMDNVLALFMLPLFGSLSDRSHTRLGKRMPYILGGTAAAVILMNLLPVADRRVSQTLFIVLLGLLLIAMGTYRSPAVALMPDVTPKPLRSKGNAIINLMGALGGAFVLGVTGLLVKENALDGRADYTLLILAVSVLMVVTVLVLAGTIRENKLAREIAEQEKDEPKTEALSEGKGGFAALEPAQRKSLLLILLSVFFWFMGYDAVTSAFTRYVSAQWNYGIGAASQCLMVATIGALISYWPVGVLATKFGRKRVIQVGVLLLAGCFAASGAFLSFHWAVYGVFALVGASWAMINVNSYPMVVEISKGADVGKFTGYYYTFSMAAKIAAPILSGQLLHHVGYWTLMPYAALMVAVSFVTISMTKHGDSKPQPPQSRLEAFADND